MSAAESQRDGPFGGDDTDDAVDPLERIAQLAFKRGLGLTQLRYRSVKWRQEPFDDRERNVAQDELINLCALYRALPEVDRVNLGKDIEEIFLLIAEELLWAEGSEGPDDGLLADEVLRVFLGATTCHPLGFVNEWPEEGGCGGWEIHDGRRNGGGQTLMGSVIWLEPPRSRTECCGCAIHEGTAQNQDSDS